MTQQPWQKELNDFFTEHSGQLSISGATLLSGILSADMGNYKGAIAAFVGCGAQSIELMRCIQKECGPIWNKYEALQYERGKLTRMNLSNREASYAKCILEKKNPKIYFAPENDTPGITVITSSI